MFSFFSKLNSSGKEVISLSIAASLKEFSFLHCEIIRVAVDFRENFISSKSSIDSGMKSSMIIIIESIPPSLPPSTMELWMSSNANSIDFVIWVKQNYSKVSLSFDNNSLSFLNCSIQPLRIILLLLII